MDRPKTFPSKPSISIALLSFEAITVGYIPSPQSSLTSKHFFFASQPMALSLVTACLVIYIFVPVLEENDSFEWVE